MDQPNETQNQPSAPVQPASPPTPPNQGESLGGAATPPPQIPPAQTQPQQPTQAAEPPKKSHAWIWVLGGCLGIVILGVIAMVALGWWGARKAKKGLEKYTPNLEQMKENSDKWNKEAEEWERKSEEFRNSMPNPEDFPAPEQMPK